MPTPLRAITPADLIASIIGLFGLTGLPRERVHTLAKALYASKPEANIVRKRYAGDAPYYLHEVARHLVARGLHLNPLTMPTEVVRGFSEFAFRHDRDGSPAAMQFGFGEWLRMRSAREAFLWTDAQQAANTWAENALDTMPDAKAKLDRVRDLFDRFVASAEAEAERESGERQSVPRPRLQLVQVDSEVRSNGESTHQEPSPPAKTTALRKAAKVLLIVHLLGFTGSFCYYSWQHVEEYGFWNWVLLGELAPLGKSLVWPYYVVRATVDWQWSTADNESLSHLAKATAAANQALSLVQQFSKSGIPSEEDAEQVTDLVRKALDENRLVRDDTLAKIHRDFPRMYHDKFVAALQHFLETMEAETSNARDFDQVLTLWGEWDDWLKSHRQEMKMPPPPGQ